MHPLIGIQREMWRRPYVAGDNDVAAALRDGMVQESDRLSEQCRATSTHRAGSGDATDHDRREDRLHAVDQARIEKCAVNGGATLNQQRQHVLLPEAIEQRFEHYAGFGFG